MWKDWERMCSGGQGGKGPADMGMNCDPKWAEQQMQQAMKDGVPMATIEMKKAEWQQVCGDAMSGKGPGPNFEPTPLMFYWTGFDKEGTPPQPIWFHTDQGCEFSIGEPWAEPGTRARG
jgi:hypothetical protein